MSVDKDFLRNMSIQTGLVREELKALKDCTESSPGFMEQHGYCCKIPMSRCCKDLPCPTSLCPLHPEGGICGEPFPAAKGRKWRGNKRKLKGWLADVLNTGITECITPAKASHGVQRRPESCTDTFSLEDILSGTAEDKWEIKRI